MRYLQISLLAVFFGCATDNNGAEKDSTETKAIVTALASDQFNGRYPGTEGFEKAVNYVEAYFKANNIQPFFDTYRDSLDVNGAASYNVVGLIGEHHPDKEYIILGAHLDHLSSKKQRNSSDSIYNGANDNASGSTAVLQIGKMLAQQKFDQNVLLVLFTGEETGLQGSKHLAKKLKAENLKLAYMLNFEMIGKTYSESKNSVYITGYHLSNMAEAMNNKAGVEFVYFLEEAKKMGLFHRSDNYPFYQEFNVPCQTISSFDFKNYDYYHHVEDEVENLDIDNMDDIINTSGSILQSFLKEKIVISHSK